MKTYVMGTHLNHLIEMVQMGTHNMFSLREKKNYPWIITNLLLLFGPLISKMYFLNFLLSQRCIDCFKQANTES